MLGGSNAPSGAAGFTNEYSINFDGVNDEVSIANAAVLTPNNSSGNRGFSCSLWVKTTNVNNPIFEKASTGSLEYTYGISKSATPFMKFFGSNNLSTFIIYDAQVTINDGNWHNIVFTWNLGGGKFDGKIYVDGVEYSQSQGNQIFVSKGSFSTVSNTSSKLRMGTGGITAGALNGNLDEVALFDDYLTSTEAGDIYNSGTPTDLSTQTYLLGWWRNGDTAGTSVFPTITDNSSNSNDGIMTNMSSGDIVTVVP